MDEYEEDEEKPYENKNWGTCAHGNLNLLKNWKAQESLKKQKQKDRWMSFNWF